MIKFKQKEFSESDAMRPFYVKLQKEVKERRAPFVQVIGRSEMIPILSGNNVIIEKFVLVDKFLGKDTFKMYLRFGNKVKLPDSFKLSDFKYENQSLLGGSKIDVDLSLNNYGNQQNNNNNNKKNKNNNNNNNQGGGNKGNGGNKSFNGKKPYQRLHSQKQFAFIDPKISGLGFSLSRDVKVSLGEAVFYDKKSRIAVLEFKSIEDAIRSLNILPLGLNYKLYLLDV